MASKTAVALYDMQSAAIREVDAIGDRILSESPFGDVTIRDVRAREQAGFGGDGDYVHLVVYADDPEVGADTWSRNDVFELRRRVLQLASESDIELPQIVVDVYPKRDAEPPVNGNRHDSSES
jgi:hypothetical protein